MASEWLRQYGNAFDYRWRLTEIDGQRGFHRPLGLVESTFDSDGRYYEGRADINNLLELNFKSSLSKEAFRERIDLAWTCLRSKHGLLRAKAVRLSRDTEPSSIAPDGLHFVVDVLKSAQDALADSKFHRVYLDDVLDDHIDPRDFYQHVQNCKRVVDPEVALAKLFVYRIEPGEEHSIIRFLFVGGHQIWDGLTSYFWMRDFIDILNQPPGVIYERIVEAIDPDVMQRSLPLTQEALYPQIPGSLARQRWFWAITRILRHVHTQLPVGFSNPLQRTAPRTEAVALSPTYHPALDYSQAPVLNTHTLFTSISRAGTRRLQQLCREAHASIGAGIFALVALTMMEMYEAREPAVDVAERKCFITGFPLNPRAFFHHPRDPESLMLAFSDGIALPFLPSALSLDGRIRLLARQAHRQLASYQKRARPQGDEAARQFLNSRGAGLVLANQYLYSLERADANLPTAKQGSGAGPQGAFPLVANSSVKTCGVSSVGRQDAIFRKGTFDLADSSKDLVADLRCFNASVRARPGEFLVGIFGTPDGLFAACSTDVSTMDPAWVERWRDRFESALDDSSGGSKKARL